MNNRLLSTSENALSARQVCFVCAFVLPIYKLLELPSLLARFAEGDLLLPALLQFLLQGGVLALLLFIASSSNKTLLERLEDRLGKGVKVLYGVFFVIFLTSAVLPLLDLEKFVYAVFYDTSPTLFSFAAFFVFSAFFCTKSLKSVGRVGDLSAFLFPFPFLALIVMSLVEADISNLLPLFERPFTNSLSAVKYTTPHFVDVILLLPLIASHRFEKGDGVKIGVGYGVGAIFSMLFFAVFYGVYSTIALRKHYAFAKIAQYFPVLSVVGRIDLIFVYMLCVVLFFYVATPLRHATSLAYKIAGGQKIALAFIINALAFLFVLFCNKYYDSIYFVFGNYLFPVFWVFTLSPLLLFLLKKEKKRA